MLKEQKDRVESLEEFGVRGKRWSEKSDFNYCSYLGQQASSWRQRVTYTIVRSAGDATSILGQVGVGHGPGAKGKRAVYFSVYLLQAPTAPLPP